MNKFLISLLGVMAPGLALASGGGTDLTSSAVGYTAIAIFVVAYLLVMAEEFTHLRKSKPVILAAGLIWAIIAMVYAGNGDTHSAEQAVRHNILEFAELMLFLLVAMTYINAMEERNVFDSLRAWLVSKGFGFRKLFWMTGLLAFFISPIADNLTTALLMCAVVLAVGESNPKFVGLACINIVVAANAGGAFSPFGDITTLMVWQKGIVEFQTFFALFVPSVVNWLVPASIMHFAVPDEQPTGGEDAVHLKRGAKRVIILFLCTIATAVSFHNFLHLPPMLGMMTGLAYLQFFGYYLKKSIARDMAAQAYQAPAHAGQAHEGHRWSDHLAAGRAEADNDPHPAGHRWSDHDAIDPNEDSDIGEVVPFDVFNEVARAEWDTLLFFFGVVLCVGGLGFIGYLELASQLMYTDLGPTIANIIVGVLSAIVDNIPVMFAVLTMQPEMSQGQWLLVTLTAGVGGSMLSIGSAAGVALMGMARGKYTFFNHLRWTPVIALGYAASIWVHMMVNASYF